MEDEILKPKKVHPSIIKDIHMTPGVNKSFLKNHLSEASYFNFKVLNMNIFLDRISSLQKAFINPLEP